jgi:UDP-2,3-diacylglucosamine pyrophosphatase LpxH
LTTPTPEAARAPLADVVVLSDLHLGRGRSTRTGLYHPLETFFHDGDMRRFLAWVAADAQRRGKTVRVVFNGDTFDLLRTEIHPAEGETSRREFRFGRDPSPEVVGQQMAAIVAGHAVFIEALADLVADGHEVVFLPGNHDLELQWDSAQKPLIDAVRRSLTFRALADVELCLGRLSFAPWFVYEPGRLWLEHGCQYDPESAFHFPLRRPLEGAFPPAAAEEDLPMGSFFQRYLYNGFGAVTFLVPSTRANARYARWLLVNQPRLLFRVVWGHLPFIWQLMRRLSRHDGAVKMAMAAAHARELDRLATQSGLGDELLALDAGKVVLGSDLAQALEDSGRQALRGAGRVLALVVAAAGLWSSGLLAINDMGPEFGLKTLLFLALNVAMMFAVIAATTYLLLSTEPPPSPPTLRAAARDIARRLDVPVVAFGHTHEEVFWRFERAPETLSTYVNTGTWVAVFAHHDAVPRERVQMSFLRVVDHEPELLYWSPGRGEPVPVVLFEEDDADAPGRT